MKLSETIDKFPHLKILVIGDVMLDQYIIGRSTRNSPEAPVPVIDVEEKRYCLGGAANVAKNLSDIRVSTYLMGAVGCDYYGDILKKELDKNKIFYNFSDHSKTTVKTRVILNEKHVCRLDEEEKFYYNERNSYFLKEHLKSFPDLNGIIIQDYGKGFITQKLIHLITEFARSRNIITVCDPNINNILDYTGVDYLKPNLTEAGGIFEVFYSDHSDQNVCMYKFLKSKYSLKGLVVTLGDYGISYIEDSEYKIIPARKVNCVDVSGLGDTVVSFLTSALCAGASLGDSTQLANIAASIAATKLGTSSVTPSELKSIIIL